MRLSLPSLKRTLILVGALSLAHEATGQAFDSATSACRRTPAYCARIAGEEAVVPTVRGGAEVASVAATLRVLTPQQRSRIEQELVACAEWAHEHVNHLRLGGRPPTHEQCQEVLVTDGCGRKVTRAMQLGSEKHERAIQCTRERLETLIPRSFSLEQRYRYDRQTRQTQLVSQEEARALLKKNCGDELIGTLVPDVVIHSGNPLEALAVYDFKFPCPTRNPPNWRNYPQGHPYHRSNQGEMYEAALRVKPRRVAPVWRLLSE